MIVYGWNSKELKQAPFPGHICPACGAENSFIVVDASYFHVFWIPIFPYNKKLRIVCGDCGHTMKPKEVSQEVRQFAKQLKSKVKIPVWMFSGVGVVTLLIVYGIISSFLNGQKELEMLNDPQVNDIYFFYDSEEPTEYKYYLRKVVAVRGASIDVSPYSFSYNMEPEELEMEDGFFHSLLWG